MFLVKEFQELSYVKYQDVRLTFISLCQYMCVYWWVCVSIGVGLCEGICLGMGLGMKECLCMCLNLGQYVSPLSTNELPKATIWFCGFASRINILLLFEKYFN